MSATTVLPLATGIHKCICSLGTSPALITPLPQGNPVMEGGVFFGKIQDIMPGNLTPQSGSFGMCKSLSNPAVAKATADAKGVLTPKKCMPSPAGPWISPATATILINGQPAFMMAGATRRCSFNGLITSQG